MHLLWSVGKGLVLLLVGFGFLMVFANRYGYGAVTGTYLVVAAGVGWNFSEVPFVQ